MTLCTLSRIQPRRSLAYVFKPSFSVQDGVVTVHLPPEWRTLPASDTLHIAARATLTRAHHGRNQVSDGGTICYTDMYGVRKCDQGAPAFVEAGGAVVNVDYFCEGGGAGVVADGVGNCTVSPDQASQIRLRVIAYNTGDALARNVSGTINLPDGVIAVGAPVSVNFGDIAPGGRTVVRHTLDITPKGEAIRNEITGWQFTVVNDTWGQFIDTASQRLISGQFGDNFAVNVRWRPRYVYLPLVLRADTRPDLVITAFSVIPANPVSGQPAMITIQVKNQGGAATGPFYIDFYINPSIVPTTAGYRWEDVCGVTPCDGIAWLVNGLGPGEIITRLLRWSVT
jgi:hypothetical protein